MLAVMLLRSTPETSSASAPLEPSPGYGPAVSSGISDRLADDVAALPDPVVRDRFQVLDLPQPGKSRTVHRFIHDLSRPQAGVLGFLDGDVHLPQPDTLARMLGRKGRAG